MDEQTTSLGGLDRVASDQMIQGKVSPPGKDVKFKLPIQPSAGAMPSSILEDMERLYQEKVAAQSPFQDWIKDALAWGGTEKPGTTLETVRRRGEEKSGQDAELFNMRAQIAAARAQQAQQAQEAERFWGLQGQAGVASPQAAAQGVQMANQATGGLLGLVQDPALRMQIGAQFMTDRPKAISQLNQYLAKRAEEPEVAKSVRYLVEQQGMDPQQALPVALLKVVGSGALTPHDVRGVGGTTQTTPLQAANAGFPTPQAGPAIAPAQAGPAIAPARVGPAVAPAPVAPRVAPAAPVSPTGFTPGSKEDIELRQKKAEIPIIREKTEAEGIAKEMVQGQAALLTSGETAGERLAAIQNINNLITKFPNSVGVLAKPNLMSAILTAAAEGVSAGNYGMVNAPGIEKAVRQVGGNDEDISVAQELGREFAKIQLANARSYLKGQGAVSDAERRLIGDMSGRTGDTKAAIERFMTWQRMLAENDKKLYKDFIDWRKTNRNASFEDFKLSDTYQGRLSAYEKQLVDFANQPAYGKGGEKKAPHPGESLLSKYPPKK